MDEGVSPLEGIVSRCASGAISPEIALMEMLIEAEDEDRVAEALAASKSPGAAAIVALRRANADGCARIVAMLRSGMDSPPKNATVEEGIAFCRRLFDWSVGQSEEASVALYSLGNPALLRAATSEIVSVLDAWGSLGSHKRALDIGCGIGRLEEALAPKLAEIHAVDVSEAMISVARRRSDGLRNVSFSTCTGMDLGGFDDESFDLVFAVDSFPYLVQSGMALVRTHFAEAARVLRANGELVILNFAYGTDASNDCDDVAALATAHGFEVLVAGTTPFALWNGTAFRLRRRAAGSSGSRSRR